MIYIDRYIVCLDSSMLIVDGKLHILEKAKWEPNDNNLRCVWAWGVNCGKMRLNPQGLFFFLLFSRLMFIHFRHLFFVRYLLFNYI